VIDPIRLSFEVACPLDHAFETWAVETSRWWPASHTVSGEDGLEVRFEPRAGGRIYERRRDGREHDWGEVTAWEPPHRLGYLWHLRADRADATDVEITFVPVADGRTRVEIEHRGWERLATGGQERRDANRGGWAGLLPHYAAAAADGDRSTDREGDR
jgi:uncharacterized protein YndB with AHSA1/START domain